MPTKDPYGQPWKPSKGRIEVPAGVPRQPRNFKSGDDVRLGWFWYEGRVWQKPPTFRSWPDEFAFKCGRHAASQRLWLGHGIIRHLLANIPPQPEAAPVVVKKPIEREGFEGAVARELPDAFRTTMHGMFKTDEAVDGVNVNDTAAAVMLYIAFGPVLPNPIKDEAGWPRCMVTRGVPVPSPVERWPDGTYHLACKGSFETMPVSEAALKVMRARYLLVHGFFWRHLRVMPHMEREEVLARFFPGGTWTPAEGSELATALGMAG